jgi:hypothetical protein
MLQRANWEKLRAFAQKNYSNGGHWIVETHDLPDYQRYFDVVVGGKIVGHRTLKEAMAQLKAAWKFQQELYLESKEG